MQLRMKTNPIHINSVELSVKKSFVFVVSLTGP